MLLLDVIVFDYVYALGASRSGSYYYHPEVVAAACVPVGDTGAMRLAAAAAAAAAAVVAACVPERGTEEKGLVLLTPPTQGADCRRNRNKTKAQWGRGITIKLTAQTEEEVRGIYYY